MTKQPKIDQRLLKEALWRKGHLSWLLDSNQKALYDLFYNTDHRVQTWLLARRSGKSYCICVLAIETCLKKPGAIVKFLAPTRVQVNLIIRPLMRKILESCPSPTSSSRPEPLIQANPCWSFWKMTGSRRTHTRFRATFICCRLRHGLMGWNRWR